MGLNYRHLDGATRAEMTNEILGDVKASRLYLSDNLSPQGAVDYPKLLAGAAATGTDDSFAVELSTRLNSHEKPRTNSKTGTVSTPKMRSNAHTMLAEGEFNRLYIRALCLVAVAKSGDGATVTVYRAKAVESPRPDSEAKIGTTVSAKALLADLRSRIGLDTHLGLPAGPNSGLSVHL